MFARLGASRPPPASSCPASTRARDVGRCVYHSGTVGACLTARNGDIAGVAVEPGGRTGWGVEGQGWEGVG